MVQLAGEVMSLNDDLAADRHELTQLVASERRPQRDLVRVAGAVTCHSRPANARTITTMSTRTTTANA